MIVCAGENYCSGRHTPTSKQSSRYKRSIRRTVLPRHFNKCTLLPFYGEGQPCQVKRRRLVLKPSVIKIQYHSKHCISPPPSQNHCIVVGIGQGSAHSWPLTANRLVRTIFDGNPTSRCWMFWRGRKVDLASCHGNFRNIFCSRD